MLIYDLSGERLYFVRPKMIKNSELQQQNEQLMKQNKTWKEQSQIQNDILMAYHNYDYSANKLSQNLTKREI
jgi:myo-inositol-hexaphosphate 3-phosphohydrolase